jgi:hypothetical protein
MTRHLPAVPSLTLSVGLAAAIIVLSAAYATAQCPATELISGLQLPLGITQSNQGNLIVSEAGTMVPNTGRISLIDTGGNRRTLIDGLPSGINDVLEPSGPYGVFMRGRILYVAIGVGDVGVPGPVPGTTAANPNPPSSPLFSSVLAIHFSANVETITEGFSLTAADHQTLAGGGKVTLTNGGGEKLTVELVVNFLPDYVPNPLPFFADNIRVSNPFDLVAVADRLYVTDGGQNAVWQVDLAHGTFSTLATFAPIANPFFNPTPPPPSIGGPMLEAVPTGIRYIDGELLVNLFRGVPFPPNLSVVEQVDPVTGSHAPFISGLKTAIDVEAVREGSDTDHLVLQHSSGLGPFFAAPGLLLRFDTPDGSPTTVADCLIRPASMTLDAKSGTVYVTEYGGRLVAIPLTP